MKIKVLPDSVVNQISAGEVVERPSSVVRELVENSVDAGATDILVALEQGGHSSLRVLDNGCGMVRDDVLLALERHATSKIRSTEDLQNIITLGFRGEALPSIASVSKMTMRSRVAADEVGTEATIHGGAIKEVRSGAFPVGTEIEVKSLFYNTPVRRKFLKSPRTEELRVKQWLTASALSRPHIRYRLLVDGKEVLNLPKRESIAARAASLFKGGTVPILSSVPASEVLAIEGVVGHPSLAQGDAGAFLILVNGRVVSDRVILRAVKEGFSSTLKDREFPIGFISLSIDPEKVDVNVHPQKSEVRFSSPQNIFVAVRDIVQSSTKEFRSPLHVVPSRSYNESSSYIPSQRSGGGVVVVSRTESSSTPAYAASQTALAYSSMLDPSLDSVGFSAPIVRESSPVFSSKNQEMPVSGHFKFSSLRYIGQALACYLFCELEERVYVVDMHAAHERYNYNLIRNGFHSKRIASQQLLVPFTITVGEEAVDRFRDYQELLAGCGFEIEEFGEGTLRVLGVPSILKEGQIPLLIKEIVGTSADENPAGKVSEVIDHIAARIACHASIRSGEKLEREEVYALFASLDSTEFSSACPHGRPIIVSFSSPEIEKWFGRDR